MHNQLSEELSKSFNKLFTTTSSQHGYNIRSSRNNAIIKPITNSVTYGLNSVKYRAPSDWNEIIKHTNTEDINRTNITKSLKERIFKDRLQCFCMFF